MPQISPQKARINKILASLLTGLVAILFLAIVWKLKNSNSNRFYIVIGIGSLVCYQVYQALTAKYRKRNALLSIPFPKKWRTLLSMHVSFYNALSDKKKHQFEQNIQIFIAEKRITGIKTPINDKIRILVASSAIIPIFGFKEWEYDNLGEVLIYPNSFDRNFKTEGSNRSILGMVGNGNLSGIMILSKNALVYGFTNADDGHHTAIHEFIHLIDGQDGSFDGVPSLLLENKYVLPWLDLMYKEIEKIKTKKSSINPYGATNKVEFFAVASEYFFEKPVIMKKNYPELYKMLVQIFHQDLTNKIKYQFRDLINYSGRKIGRNAPCPCGSGKKYKKCCLVN